ncbi:MAG TPA: tape measure protein, partial [Hyphomicrobiaceae bacterium]|nr:tape measure protein [Hyphomicrobiaceae bacterium]
MAVEVSRLVVKISADTAEAERGLQRAQSAVQGFSGFLQHAAASAVGFVGAMVGMRAIDGAVSAAKDAMIGFNASMEQSRIAFTTMLKSGEAAQAFLFDLQQFAARTPFEFQDVERGAKRLLAMGFAAKDVKPLLTAVGDAASALGLGASGIDRITLSLGQMQAKTKVSAEEMLQLTEAGIPAWEILADAVGKPIPEVMKLAEQGKIASGVFIEAFQRFSQQNFGGMMEQQSKTFLGALSTIKDAVTIVAATAFQPLFSLLSELAQRIAVFVQSEQFSAWGARIAATIEVVLEGLGVLGEGFRAAFSGIAAIVTTVGQIIFEALQLLNPFARHSPSLVDAVSAGVDSIISKFASLRVVETPLRTASHAVHALREAARNGMAALEAATDAAKAKTLAVFGSAVPAAYAAAQHAIDALSAQLSVLDAAMAAQESVVSRVREELDAATAAVRAKEAAIRALERTMRSYDAAVEAAESHVQRMREAVGSAKSVVDRLRDAIDQAQDRIRQLASAPLQGTKEFRDRLGDINQKINETQLQLTRLRLTDAPEGQIAALELQLERLKLQADEVRLEEAVQFDPLRRQIEQLTNTTQELPFEEIVRGITEQQASIATLQAQLEPATAAWEQQTAALREAEAGLKAAQAARDEFRKRIESERLALEQLQEHQNQVQERYAAEQEKLAQLKDAYGAIQQQIDQYRAAIEAVVQRAETLARMNEQAAKASDRAAASFSAAAASAASAVRSPLEGLDLTHAQQQIESWRASFASTRDDIRQQMLPTFENLRSGLESAGTTMQSVASRLQEMKEPLANIAAFAIAAGGAFVVFQNVIMPIIGVVGAVLSLKTAIAAVGGIIPAIVAALGGPLTVAILAIAAVIGGLYLAWRNNWFGMREVIDRVLAAVVGFFKERIAIITDWAAKNWPLIQRTVETVMNAIRGVVNFVLTQVQTFWQAHGDRVIAILSAAWTMIKTVIDTAIHTVLDIITLVMQIITGDWEGAWETIKGIGERLWEAIKTI